MDEKTGIKRLIIEFSIRETISILEHLPVWNS